MAALDCRRVRFEKWHALGNDYIIVERDALPFELTPARVRAICAGHTGVFSDGILLLSEPSQPGFVARVQIFNPDGSEAEMSGNGTREAALYLRRHGWAGADQFSIETAAGEIRPTITSPTTAAVDLGRARLRTDDYPSGADDGRGELTDVHDGHTHTWAFQHVVIGNPQCSIRVADADALAKLKLGHLGPGIERHALFPHRTNVSWYTPLADDRIRARIFERGVGETSASGTGASGAAIAHVLAGGDSPVTVELEGGELQVAVGEDLHVTLSGWAVPVFSGTLADEFVQELHATE
jgi:diaminopimelate epimerase